MNTQRTHILVLDDEPDILEEINEFLTNNNIQVYEAGTPTEAFRILSGNTIDVVILDICLPEMNGFDVFKEIQRLYPKIRVIMMSGNGDVKSVLNALRLGAFDYLQKPFRLKELMESVERARKCANNSMQLNPDHVDYQKEIYFTNTNDYQPIKPNDMKIS
jgi:DNA-binding NtrC family response regulator